MGDCVLGGLVHLAVGLVIAVRLENGVPAKDSVPSCWHNDARCLPDENFWLYAWAYNSTEESFADQLLDVF